MSLLTTSDQPHGAKEVSFNSQNFKEMEVAACTELQIFSTGQWADIHAPRSLVKHSLCKTSFCSETALWFSM